MLRTTSSSLFAKTSTVWKSPVVYSTIKTYATANSATTPAATNTASEEKKDTSLSARLGGSGRGKVITEGGATSSDPFASFLANAKKPRGQNNNRNGNFIPRPRKQQGENKGQFADVTETTDNKTPRQPRTQREANNIRPHSQQRKTEGGDSVATTAATEQQQQRQGNKQRQPRTNNNRNRETKQSDGSQQQQQQSRNRRLSLTRSQQQPQEVRTRRATTFIDKDIDWSSFTLEETSVGAVEQQPEQQPEQAEDVELLSKDIQGDYTRYLTVGSDIKWSQMVNGTNVVSLVGSNPTFDLSQKTAFLAAVSFATNASPAAAAAGGRK